MQSVTTLLVRETISMKLRYTEDFGRFNWAGTESSYYFRVNILDDEGNVIKVDDVNCELYYSIDDEDKTGCYGLEYGIRDLAHLALEYSDKVWGTTDYKKQCLNFIKVYNENKKAIVDNYTNARKEEIKKQIERLTKDLETAGFIEESIDVNYYIDKKVESKRKYIEKQKSELAQYVVGSEKYQKNLDYITEVEKEIEELSSIRYE